MPLDFQKGETLKYLGYFICPYVQLILKKIKEKHSSDRDKCWCECSKGNPCAVLVGR